MCNAPVLDTLIHRQRGMSIPCTAGSANSVYILLNVPGEVKVEDMRDIMDI